MNKITTSIVKLLIILSVLATSVSAASMPLPIYGIVTLEGTRADAMEVQLKNLNSGEILTRYTQGGGFVLDKGDFKQGTSGTFEITYCVSDSRCDPFVRQFTISGDQVILSQDLPIKTPGGLSNPYVIYGIVEDSSGPLIDVDVIVTNLNKGSLKTVRTILGGEYQVNLANLGNYDTGDLVRSCYLSTCVQGNVINNAGTLELNILQSSTPPTPPTEPDNDDWIYEDGYDDTIEDDKDETKPTDPDDKDDEDKKDGSDDGIIISPSDDDKYSYLSVLGVILGVLAILGVGYYFLIYKKRKG